VELTLDDFAWANRSHLCRRWGENGCCLISIAGCQKARAVSGQITDEAAALFDQSCNDKAGLGRIADPSMLTVPTSSVSPCPRLLSSERRQRMTQSGSTPHDHGTDARHMQIRSMSVLASSRQRYPSRRHVNVAVRQNSKAQHCVTKTTRDPFTIQFTHMPRGKIARVVATFHHIDA
jgi:hypothetical protein